MGEVRQNARENGQISPQPPFRAARGDSSCPNLAAVLQEGRKIASIHASSGAIWRIPVLMIAIAAGRYTEGRRCD
jgi:hypothetical protein